MGTISELFKDMEVVFTVLVACSAALAGIGGYLAAKANGEASEASQNAQLYFNEANTLYLESNQYYFQDKDLFSQAALAEYEQNPKVAEFLRSQTYMCELGYINADGTIPSEYSGDFDSAWDAYYSELYNPYEENMALASYEFTNSSLAGERGDAYLLSTVMLAISATFGAVGLAADTRRVEKVMLALMLLFILVSLVLMLGA
jgi:hypothetical protein